MPQVPFVYSSRSIPAPPMAMGAPSMAMGPPPMAVGAPPMIMGSPPFGVSMIPGGRGKTRRRYHFRPEDDDRLTKIMETRRHPLGVGEWANIAEEMGAPFSPQQCQDRWANYLRPPLDKTPLTVEEKRLLVKYWVLNPREWKKIANKAQHYKIRSAAFVKNYLNSQIRKMTKMGVKPVTPEEVDLLPDCIFVPGIPDPQEMDAAREIIIARRLERRQKLEEQQQSYDDEEEEETDVE